MPESRAIRRRQERARVKARKQALRVRLRAQRRGQVLGVVHADGSPVSAAEVRALRAARRHQVPAHKHSVALHRARDWSSLDAIPVCPPEWNLTPSEYEELVTSPRRGPIPQVVGLALLGLSGGLWLSASLLGFVGAAIFCALALGATVTFAVGSATRTVRTERLLSTMDARRVEQLRRAAAQTGDASQLLLDAASTDVLVRAAGLGALYEHAVRTARDAVARGEEPPRLRMHERLTPGGRARPLSRLDPWTPRTQAPLETPTKPEPRPRESLAAQWHQALTRHDTIRDAWGALVIDPLSALTHSTLFDVSAPRTAAFIEAYGLITDTRALHGGDDAAQGPVPDHDTVTAYATAVRRCAAVWSDALAYATRSGYTWLPEPERARARRAEGLLTLAADESASWAERAAAAEKAAALLKRIDSFLLPPQALAALDEPRRRALGATGTPAP